MITAAGAAVSTAPPLPPDRAWLWLERGWRDFKRAPSVGLAYGLAVVAISYVVAFGLALGGQAHLVLPAIGGFFIIAPLLGAGLYDVSRRLESGQPVSLPLAISAWRAPGQIALMGMVLLVINLLWIRLALLLYMLTFSELNPTLETIIPQLLGTPEGLVLLVVGTGFGAVLATLTFAVAALSLPMLVDKEASVLEAVIHSLRTVSREWRAMALWAATIVVLVGIGIATFFIGLAIAVPLVAHATWHAYRDTLGG